MAVKAISEFTIQPGRREEFVRLFESLMAQHFESMRAAGGHSATIYVVVDDPDRAVEISEWESAEARERMKSISRDVSVARESWSASYPHLIGKLADSTLGKCAMVQGDAARSAKQAFRLEADRPHVRDIEDAGSLLGDGAKELVGPGLARDEGRDLPQGGLFADELANVLFSAFGHPDRLDARARDAGRVCFPTGTARPSDDGPFDREGPSHAR
jgi:quinol monooxygenase YgiN